MAREFPIYDSRDHARVAVTLVSLCICLCWLSVSAVCARVVCVSDIDALCLGCLCLSVPSPDMEENTRTKIDNAMFSMIKNKNQDWR